MRINSAGNNQHLYTRSADGYIHIYINITTCWISIAMKFLWSKYSYQKKQRRAPIISKNKNRKGKHQFKAGGTGRPATASALP
jgi:hypothetical protein